MKLRIKKIAKTTYSGVLTEKFIVQRRFLGFLWIPVAYKSLITYSWAIFPNLNCALDFIKSEMDHYNLTHIQYKHTYYLNYEDFRPTNEKTITSSI